MNIFIYPSPSDSGKLRGLCGNFNGDVQDDLRKSTDEIVSVHDYDYYSYDYYWWEGYKSYFIWDDPDGFSGSWG